jgi:hypothetical protein
MVVDESHTDLIAEVLLTCGDRHSESALPLLDAIGELIDWLAEIRPFDGRYRSSWDSAAKDVDASLAASGPAIRTLIAAAWTAFKIGAAIEHAKIPALRSADIAAVEKLRSQLVSDVGLEATWLDLVAAASLARTQEVWFPLACLRSVYAARGLDLTERSGVLAGVLQDRLLDVEYAKVKLDPTREYPVHDVAAAITASAGLAPPERVKLATALLLAPSTEADYIVWLAVARASLNGMHLRVETVQFFDSAYIAAVLDVPPLDRVDGLPDEIRQMDAARKPFPSSRTVLLARIDMGCRHSSFVIRDARRLLLALLAPAGRALPRDWAVMPGSVVFQDGQEVSWSAFDNLEDENVHHLGRVAVDWLDGAGRELAAVLPAQPNQELDRILELMEWDSAHRSTDPLTTLLLAVRTIETVAQRQGMDWQALARRYAPDIAWARLKSELGAAAWKALYAYRYHPDPVVAPRLQEIFLEVVQHKATSIATNLESFVSYLPELIDLWDLPLEAQRDPIEVRRFVRVAELRQQHQRWTSKSVFDIALDECKSCLDLQISRAVRLRNAAQHGGPLQSASISSVASLIDSVRQRILGSMLHGLLNGRSGDQTLRLLPQLEADRRSVVDRSGQPIGALHVVRQ